MADYALRGSAEQRTADRSRAGRSPAGVVVRWAVAVLALVFIGEVLFHLVVKDLVLISEVMIDSDATVANRELLELAGVAEGASYFDVDTVAAAARIEDHPAVRRATVRKVFPGTLQVTVTGRRALVIAFAAVGDRELPVAIDENGVAFQFFRDIDTWDLPVFSGIRFEDFSVGTRLPDRLVEILQQLSQLRLVEPTLFEQISEIRASGGGGDAIELLIYPIGYKVPVRIEDKLDASLFRYIIMVLDMFEREGRLQNIRELDFRGGQIVFRSEEE